MILDNLKNFKNGWFIGNFVPSIHNRPEFEIGLLEHKKGDKWASHYHKISREINVLLEGEMLLHDQLLIQNDIFIIEPWEIADPEFLEDCKVLCIKIPSCPGDKYEVIHSQSISK